MKPPANAGGAFCSYEGAGESRVLFLNTRNRRRTAVYYSLRGRKLGETAPLPPDISSPRLFSLPPFAAQRSALAAIYSASGSLVLATYYPGSRRWVEQRLPIAASPVSGVMAGNHGTGYRWAGVLTTDRKFWLIKLRSDLSVRSAAETAIAASAGERLL